MSHQLQSSCMARRRSSRTGGSRTGGSRTGGSCGSSGGGSSGSGGGLHGLGHPPVVELAFLDPQKYLLGGLLVSLPLRELLEHRGVLGKPLDVLEEAAEVGEFIHTLLATVLVDEFKSVRGFGKLEGGRGLSDDIFHLAHGIVIVELAFLSVSEELLPLRHCARLEEVVDVLFTHLLGEGI